MRTGYDVIIVGAGACGILAAKLLTDARRNVLLVEAGPDVRAARGEAAVASQPIQSTCWRCAGEFTELFVDDELYPYSRGGDGDFLWIRGRQLGGRMVAWSGVAVRWTDADFAPAFADRPRWPIRYADLVKYYELAEAALDVRNVCIVDPATGRYVSQSTDPWPATASQFKHCVESLWSDRQVLARPTSPTPPSSWKDAVHDMPIFRLLDAAERSGRLTVRTSTTVTAIEVDVCGRAIGIRAVDSATDEPLSFRSTVVLVCASTIETTRLLLNSKNRRHPTGLGNHAGVLGGHLMDHASGVELTGMRRTGGDDADYYYPLFIPRYRNVSSRETDFDGGYWWQGYAARSFAQGGRNDYVHVSAFGEVQPHAENRVTLCEDRRDRHGMPLIHIDYARSDNERRMMADMLATGRGMLQAAGFSIVRVVDTYGPGGSSIHEVETARMGTDPQTSVVNAHNQIWGCENVYVADGSVFVSAGSANPTLTMLALTARACDHINGAID